MKITICDTNKAVCDACREVMPPEIEVVHGSILDHEWDAVVSPANSFGFMDGGIDAVYTKRFGRGLQIDLQYSIQAQLFGELLVGQALVIRTSDARIPFMVSAPTMRTPRPIADAADIMLATRAAIRAPVSSGYSFLSIALPGMGTGAGMIKPSVAAKAMATGIQQGLKPSSIQFPASWREAYQRHVNLEG